MEWSVVLVLVLQTLLLGGLGAFFFRSRDTRAETPDYSDLVASLEARQEHLETRWKTILEELNERMEAGNKAYARARARETAYRRRKELDEGEEEYDEEQQSLDFRGGNGEASDPRGMFTLPSPMGPDTEPAWRQAARSYAQMVARGGAT